MGYWAVSSLLLTAILASLCRVEANCTRRITITVTTNATVVAPVVGEVVFMLFPGGNATFNVIAPDELIQDVENANLLTLKNTGGFREDLTVLVRSTNNSNRQPQYEVTVRFDENMVTCDNLLLSRNVTAIPFSYPCVPISSCNSTAHMSIQSLVWQRRTNVSSSYMTLVSNNSTTDGEVIRIISANGITNNTLTISSLKFQSAAYYQIVDQDDTSRVLYTFTLFHTPVLRGVESTPNDLYFENGEQEKSIFCTFTTFPDALVTWSPDENLENSSFSNTNATVNGRLLLSINGRLTFGQVAYEDAGYYECTANNNFDESSFRIRLRVKNPIRVVFPIVGIIASLVVTAIFIFGGYVVRKLFGGKESTSDQTDYDVGYKRPQSVASDDDDGVHINRKVNNRRSLQPLVSKDSVLSTT